MFADFATARTVRQEVQVEVAQFLRTYAVRAPNITWFLGAGASASASIPTAFDLIWDFKRSLYCSSQRVSIRSCSDIANPTLRARIQRHFDANASFPPENSDDEYAHYFEIAYPSEADRRRYIDRMVTTATPSYGHVALAAMLKADKARVVWTTNFDRMIEDATIRFLGTSGGIVMASLDGPDLAMQALNEGRWPIIVKLHGDFQSRRLRNTPSELRTQDAELRRALVEGCRRHGLAVVGYSGRDHSVVEALEEAIDGGRGYPFGLFWFKHSSTTCLPQVSRLIEKASAAGVDAHLIESNTFDELLGDVLHLLPDTPTDVLEHLNTVKPRISDAPVPRPGIGWPVMRLNAVPVLSTPSVCRLVACRIGGIKEVQEAVANAGVPVLATRRQLGVLAFGRDADVRAAFASHEISEFDLHCIETRRLRFESAEQGMLYDALCQAMARERPIIVKRRRSAHLLVADREKVGSDAYALLRQATQRVTGTIPKTDIEWTEAVRVRLEYRLNRLWLVFEPCIYIDHVEDERTSLIAKEFVRERSATRYNRTWNSLINGWVDVLVGPAQQVEVRAFGLNDGIDASFTIGRITGFSRPERRQ